MMNRRNRLRRAALVPALLVLAAILTGVAASATTTVIPKQLTGRWQRQRGVLMVVSPRGKVEIDGFHHARYYARFSRVTANRLSIRGVWSCSGTGTYSWTITTSLLVGLKLTKIHDACKLRVNLLANSWGRRKT